MSLNEKFVTQLFDEMARAKPSLAKYLPDEGNDLLSEVPDYRELSNVITKEFPWPIGVELRRLLSGSMEELSRGRLDQILRTYERTLQVLSFILVIDLYENLSNGRELTISDGFREEFNKRFRTLTLGDYVWLISSISNIFRKNELSFFIDEMNELFTKSFIKKAGFLVQDRNELSHYLVNLNLDDIELRCVEYFDVLGELIKELAFLIKYPMITIPEITVKKHRKSEGEFAHHIMLLNSSSSAFFGITKGYRTYTASPSVLFYTNAKDIPSSSLNMSPLIIDTHYEATDSAAKRLKLRKDVYLYSKWEEKKEKIYFVGTEATDKPDISLVSFYEILKEELADIFNTIKSTN